MFLRCLKIIFSYLVILAILDAFFLLGLVYAEVTSPVSIVGAGFLIFWFSLKFLQKTGWAFLFWKFILGKNDIYPEGRLPTSIRNVLLGSFLIDVIAVFCAGSLSNSSIDWNNLILQTREFYPKLASAVEIYVNYSPIVSQGMSILNPIPFGLSVFIWPLLLKVGSTKS